jgi:hypothetical protein
MSQIMKTKAAEPGGLEGQVKLIVDQIVGIEAPAIRRHCRIPRMIGTSCKQSGAFIPRCY